VRRIQDGFQLLGQSWQLVRRRPALVGVIAIGIVATVVVAVALYALAYRRMPHAGDFEWPDVLWLYPIFVVSGIPGTIATATVVATSMQTIDGKEGSVREGLSLTLSKLPQLIAWSLISGVVGIVIQLVAERLKLGGKIAAFLAGVSWALATMLVVPVLLFEDRGPFASVKRSAGLIKERWGEGLTGYGAMNAALMLIMLPLFVVASGVIAMDAVLGIFALGAVFLGAIFLMSALGGVFNAALYRFAVTGGAGGPFTAPQLESTFVGRAEKSPAGRAWGVVGAVVLGIYLVVKALEWSEVI
jgi:hypothetical protein